MIITFIVIAILIVGIICLTIDSKRYCSDWICEIGIVFTLLGLIATLVVGCMIIVVNTNKDIDYQNELYKREVLEYRIDNMNENVVGNEMLYGDIVEFNNSLRNFKKWSNNPWTNWFWNEDIAAIDYVELDSD